MSFKFSRKLVLFSLIMLVFCLSSFATQSTTAYAVSSSSTIQIVKITHVGYDYGHGDPNYLVYNPSNNEVYVSDYGYYCSASYGGCGGSLDRSRIAEINSTSNKVVAEVPVGYGASDIIYNPSNKEVYVINQLNNTVSVLKGVNLVKTIQVGSQNPYNLVGNTGGPLFNIVYNPSNHYVYVGNVGTNSVSIISSSTNKVVATTIVGSGPFRLGYDPSNQEVYATNYASNSISVMKGTKVVATIAAGDEPEFLSYDPSNKDMYVTRSFFQAGSILVIDGATNKIIATVSLPPHIGAQAIAYNPTNHDVYVGGTNQVDHAFIFAISSVTNNITAKVDVSSIDNYYPLMSYVAYDPVNHDTYFAAEDGYGGGYLVVLSSSNKIVTSILSSLLLLPFEVVYNPSNAYMYVSYPVDNAVGIVSS